MKAHCEGEWQKHLFECYWAKLSPSYPVKFLSHTHSLNQQKDLIKYKVNFSLCDTQIWANMEQSPITGAKVFPIMEYAYTHQLNMHAWNIYLTLKWRLVSGFVNDMWILEHKFELNAYCKLIILFYFNILVNREKKPFSFKKKNHFSLCIIYCHSFESQLGDNVILMLPRW